MAQTQTRPLDLVDKIMAFEGGKLDAEETIALFADLLNSGLCSQLQGTYQRWANSLLKDGWIAVNDAGEFARSEKELK